MNPTGSDPNRTVLGGPDPNKTVLGGPDANRTQAIAPPLLGNANRTTALSPDQLPGPAGTLTVAVTPSRVATMANGPAREQFLIEIKGGADFGLPGLGVGAPRTPLNLCLVLDRSGSMEGAPLEYARQSCAYVVDMLTPNDVLSIVTFEEVVEVLMPPQRVTNKDAIKQGISQIQPGNTTNLYDGLSLATHQLLSAQDASRATRMIVLTDGDPTAGIKDFGTLTAHAAEIKAKGITATFLGFGPDYNEELLAALAKRAGGNYYYIPSPELLPEVFRKELEKLVSVSAQNLSLHFKLARWVKLRTATGLSTPPTDSKFSLTLTDLERGSNLKTLIDVEFQNHPLGHYRVAAGKLEYDNIQTGRPESIDVDLVMEFTADAAKYSVPANPVVTQAGELMAVSRQVEKTILGLKTGQITSIGAIQELQKTQMILANEGRAMEAQEVTMALRALQSGQVGEAEKTLMGTMVNLDQGKSKS